MKKLNDFGEKIGGAKKDIWALFHSLPEEEQNEMATKNVLWKRPRYEVLESKGVPKEVLYWRNEMRKAVKSRPESNAEAYISFCTDFKEAIENCSTMDDVAKFYNDDILNFMKKVDDHSWKYASKTTKQFFDGKAVLKYANHQDRIKKDCDSSNFMEDISEKEAKKYETVKVTKDNLESRPYGKSRFANKVSSNCIHIFYDTKDYSALLAGKEALYIALYDNHRLGIFDSNEDADNAIASDKKKRAEKKTVNKKDVFLPPHLSTIERTGSSYKFFRMTEGNVLLSRYGLRGGEFGNYTTSKDRLGSINMAYDAFEDMYKAIGVSPKDISLGGNLAIAFGARGRGNAMAHYEPTKNVINITKIRGAGSLAHEWGHAMDMFIGNHFGVHGFISNNTDGENVPESVKLLVKSFMENPDGSETAFYSASKSFDGKFKKSGNGYWASAHEMFARAFACYVKDKLNGKSDYLVGHAECAVSNGVAAYPVGEERENINKRFDAFFADMLEQKVFSKEEAKTVEPGEIIEMVIFEGEDGQLKFC